MSRYVKVRIGLNQPAFSDRPFEYRNDRFRSLQARNFWPNGRLSAFKEQPCNLELSSRLYKDLAPWNRDVNSRSSPPEIPRI
jgi:hypothetical protein